MIWYPYEQMKTMREPYKILDGRGCLSLYERSETDRFGIVLVVYDPWPINTRN